MLFVYEETDYGLGNELNVETKIMKMDFLTPALVGFPLSEPKERPMSVTDESTKHLGVTQFNSTN